MICAFLDKENLHASSYADLLKTNGLKHFGNEINIGLLKMEFMNIHSQFKQEWLSQLKCFHDILDFFHSMQHYINHRAICPNFWTLIRLVALHAATTSTCERSFKLNKIVKTSIRSTMTNKRMNHLCVCKHYKDDLNKVDIDVMMNEFIHGMAERMRIFGPNVIKTTN